MIRNPFLETTRQGRPRLASGLQSIYLSFLDDSHEYISVFFAPVINEIACVEIGVSKFAALQKVALALRDPLAAGFDVHVGSHTVMRMGRRTSIQQWSQ